jgi:hypothetical protein
VTTFRVSTACYPGPNAASLTVISSAIIDSHLLAGRLEIESRPFVLTGQYSTFKLPANVYFSRPFILFVSTSQAILNAFCQVAAGALIRIPRQL